MKTEEVRQQYPPHLALHYFAGSSSVIALDHAKRLLDAKSHPVDFAEEESGYVTPLHVAAHWGNIAMCQLLIHYNANPESKDEEGNTPFDLAEDKKVRRFLKKLSTSESKPHDKKRLRTILNELFRFKLNVTTRKGKRPVSCFPAFQQQPSPIVIRRHSSLLTQEFKQNAENDLEKIIGSLSIEDKKKPMEVKENLIPQILKKEDTKLMYPILNPQLSTPSPPARLTSFNINIPNVTPQPLPKHDFIKTPSAPVESDHEDLLPKTPDVPLAIRQLSMDQLRKRLEKVGISPGPMKKDTRKLYEKRLLVAEKQNVETYQNQEYSNALDRLLVSVEKGFEINVGKIQEDTIRNDFCLGPVISREKNEVSSFCYILIDPSKIPDQRNCTFRQFLSAAFYIGKGKRSRPLQHLIDAAKCKRQDNFRGRPISDKLKRICKLWKKGHGVVSLHVFLNIHPNEALIREASMIDAFGVKNLTNLKGGEYSGNAKNWTLKEKTEFGAFCLYSAWGVYRNERCRPVFESDVADALTQKFFY